MTRLTIECVVIAKQLITYDIRPGKDYSMLGTCKGRLRWYFGVWYHKFRRGKIIPKGSAVRYHGFPPSGKLIHRGFCEDVPDRQVQISKILPIGSLRFTIRSNPCDDRQDQICTVGASLLPWMQT